MHNQSTDDDPARMNRRDIETLLAVMRRLRDPERGCPWDVKQTFETIAPYTIEEAYEVADAIARGDMAELKKELGDLLLQVVFHARMAEEKGLFDFADVVAAIVNKLIFRHPHVFGPEEERGKVAADFWEKAKEAERAAEGRNETRERSALDGIAAALPALMRAEKLQKRAARVGYDWPDASGVAEKVCEEARELAQAAKGMSASAVEEEVGDLLFSVVNLARHLGVDAETALRKANEKFERRFRAAERLARTRGKELNSLSSKELDALWDEVKNEELSRKLRKLLRSPPEKDEDRPFLEFTFTDWDMRPAVLVKEGSRMRAWAVIDEDEGWREADALDVWHTAAVLNEDVFWEMFPEAAVRKEELADIVVREFLSGARERRE